MASVHTQRGYVFVVQDCRGRFGSEGVFKPFEGEIEDGRDTIDWIVAQGWSNRRVGTIGGSYNGYTALAAAVDNPNVRAVVVDDPALDFSYGLRDGAISMLPLFWLYLLEHGKWPSEEDKSIASNTIDVINLDNTLLGHNSTFWDFYVLAKGPRDDVWSSRSLRNYCARICAPMLVVKSRSEPWEDPVQVWQAVTKNGCEQHRRDHALIVTGEGHAHHLASLGFEDTQVNGEMLTWIDMWLGQRELHHEKVAPVRFRTSSEDRFHVAASWPAATQERFFYLANPAGVRKNAKLIDEPLGANAADSIDIDPELMDPCTSYPNMSYVSEPLPHPIYVAGAPRAELRISTTGADADVSVLLYEYNQASRRPLQYVAFGSSRASAVTKVVPGEPFAITVNMHSLAHEFRAGSRIAIAVTGTLCGYAENPHTGKRPDQQTEWKPATYRIHHGETLPSRVALPVLPAVEH